MTTPLGDAQNIRPEAQDATTTDGRPAAQAGVELLEDGQEEVFSRTAVEHGLVADPLALDPLDSRLTAPGTPDDSCRLDA